MIKSMTGYGKAEYTVADHKTIVEIRSLNSKQLDLSLKYAPLFRDKEQALRSLLQTQLERGKVDVTITTQPLETSAAKEFTPINWDAVLYYANDYRRHCGELGLSSDIMPPEVMSSILRMPDVLKTSTVEAVLTDEESALLDAAANEAVAAFQAFRTQEGAALQAMFEEKLQGIEHLLAEVAPYEKGRVEKIKERLLTNLEQLAEKTKQSTDRNRLEEEMIYYLEKLDITEEKVRLTNHIRYFRECMNENGAGVGKKLGFVAQEMGREINTLGSKSNQSEMQILVVKMKDLLEQIKEQVLNVL